jgi:hypothetical protein
MFKYCLTLYFSALIACVSILIYSRYTGVYLLYLAIPMVITFGATLIFITLKARQIRVTPIHYVSNIFEYVLNTLIPDRKAYLEKQEELENFVKKTIEPMEKELYEKKIHIEIIKFSIKNSSRRVDIRPLLEIARETLRDIEKLTTDLEDANEKYEKMSK